MKKLFLAICIVFCLVTFSHSATVKLAWDANTEPSVTGYKLYMGTASRVYSTPVDVKNVTQYTLTNVPENINVFFAVTAYSATQESAYSVELPCFTLKPITPINGTITPSVPTIVSQVYPVTFTITPNTGYFTKELKVDSISKPPANSYTFTNTTQSHTIEAIFEKIIIINPPASIKITP